MTDSWVLTDSETTVMKLQIVGRPPLGNDRKLEVNIVGRVTQKRVGQVRYHASTACHCKIKLDLTL